MWGLLRNAAFFGFVYRFLRPRLKRLAICFGIIVLAIYAHAEYLSYLNALPASEAPSNSVAWAFVLKNLAIAGASVAAILPEVRKRPARAPSTSHIRTERSDAMEGDAGADRPLPDSDATDAFRDIRRKRVIRTRAEQLLSREP